MHTSSIQFNSTHTERRHTHIQTHTDLLLLELSFPPVDCPVHPRARLPPASSPVRTQTRELLITWGLVDWNIDRLYHFYFSIMHLSRGNLMSGDDYIFKSWSVAGYDSVNIVYFHFWFVLFLLKNSLVHFASWLMKRKGGTGFLSSFSRTTSWMMGA